MDMLQGVEEVKKICLELEKIRINAQSGEIVNRQQGNNQKADQLNKLEKQVTMALSLLREVE